MSKDKEETTANGIDAKSEKGANATIKKNPMPEKCRLCTTGVTKYECLVCNVTEYDQ